jgi:WD40 repeat protein
VAFTPDGRLLASGGGQYGHKSVVNLWDTSTGVLVREVGDFRNGVVSISFSGDGKVLAVAGQDQSVTFWNTATGGAAEGFASGRLRGQWVDLSPDGKLLVTNDGGTIKVIDTASGAAKAAMGQGNWGVFTLGATNVLVTSAHNTKVPAAVLYDAATGKLIRKYDLTQNQLGAAAISPDGKLFAAGSLSGPDAQNILVVEIETGKVVEKVPGAAWYGRSVAFAPDSKHLAIGGQTGMVTVRELGRDKPVAELQISNQFVQHVAFSPNGKLLATGSNMGQIRLWDAVTYREKLMEGGHRSDVQAAALSPCGKYVLTGGDDCTARLWNVADGRELRRLGEFAVSMTAAAFGTDANGALLAGVASRGDAVAVYRAPSGAKVQSAALGGSASGGGHLAFAPGGKLVCVSPGGVYALLDVASGKVEQTGRGGEKTAAVNSRISVTADGRLAASGAMGQVTTVWDTVSGRQLAVFGPMAGGYSMGIGIDPFGQFLGSDTMQKVTVLEIDSGKTFREIATGGRTHGGQTIVAFSADGTMFAVGDLRGDVAVYSLASGESLCRFTGHRNRILSMVFSADAKRLLTGSADTTAILWNLESVKRPVATAKLDEAGFAGPWDEMASGDASKAMGAVLALAAAGDAAAELLGRKLESVKGPKAEEVARLVEGLGDRQYAARQRSYEELAKLGVLVEGSLRQAAKDGGNEEVRARAEQLLAAMDDPSQRSGEALRQMRAVYVLQRIGTAKAMAVLEGLAKGAPGANLTERARRAAERLRAGGAEK